jgi:hypothetical protein
VEISFFPRTNLFSLLPKITLFATAAYVINILRRCAMKKAAVLPILFVGVLLAVAVIAEAQQPAKVPRIGYLGTSLSAIAARIEAFRQGLRELGYVEGKNIVIEWRYTEEKPERISELAAKLV